MLVLWLLFCKALVLRAVLKGDVSFFKIYLQICAPLILIGNFGKFYIYKFFLKNIQKFIQFQLSNF
jgi:hypothetical protein